MNMISWSENGNSYIVKVVPVPSLYGCSEDKNYNKFGLKTRHDITRTFLVSNKIVDHSNVVEAAPTTSPFST